MTVVTTTTVTNCMFCDGVIPANYDDVYVKHMNDHHRAFVNIELLFWISLSDSDGQDNLLNMLKQKSDQICKTINTRVELL